MGHEASGTMSSVGAAANSVKVGGLVAIEHGHPCRRCQPCKDGTYSLCPEIKFAAAPPGVHGTLTKFWKSPADFVYKISDKSALTEAVLIEPLARRRCPFHLPGKYPTGPDGGHYGVRNHGIVMWCCRDTSFCWILQRS